MSRRSTSILQTFFLKKRCQLNNYFFGTFLPSSRWSQNTVKMKGFEPSIDLDFENGFLKKVVNLTTSFLNFSALFDVVTGHCKSGVIRAGGYFGGHLGFSKLLLGASAGPRGHPKKGKTLRHRSFPRRSTRGTGSLHFCKGL